jgi:hypothetical protein
VAILYPLIFFVNITIRKYITEPMIGPTVMHGCSSERFSYVKMQPKNI